MSCILTPEPVTIVFAARGIYARRERLSYEKIKEQIFAVAGGSAVPGVLALRIVDLALFTDPETSFPTVGPSAARWGTVLVGAAALLVMGRRADEKLPPAEKVCWVL